MVDMLLGGMKWVFVKGHIGDIIVYTDTWADHSCHRRQLFEAQLRATLEWHPGKRALGPKR